MGSVSKLVNFASILEDQTRAQAERTAAMPFVRPHLALMPDAHLGKGATVGSVIPTVGAIIPAAVGVDIGCGMMAVRTQFAAGDLAPRPVRTARGDRASGPVVGRQLQRDGAAERRTADRRAGAHSTAIDQAEAVAPKWRTQLGSLGSGNHFIEVSLDEQDRVWLFLHSGSRGVGNKLAQKHIAVAQEQCARRAIQLPDRDLAYLVEGEPEFDAYLAGAALGAALRLPQPRGDDGPRRRLPGDVQGEAVQRVRGGQLPSQLHRAGAALRHGGLAVAQGCDRRP